jgi:hypothetical protein
VAVVMPFPTPWENLYQRQADEAFYAATGASDAELRALRPPLPQIIFLPDRFGYPSFVERVPTIWSVFGIARKPPAMLPSIPPKPQTPVLGFPYTEGSDRLTNGGDPLGMGGQSW